jgi:L,D-peptidoglycan transpeptidase YkuD (ErfK/YbiS/YcfS/YnhG family)
MFRLFATVVLLLASLVAIRAAEIGPDVKQLLVSVAPDWSATRGMLQRYERGKKGEWVKVGAAIPVNYGKNGLAWGRGVLGTEEKGLHKKEGDGRAPAGVFELGTIYGNDERLPAGADYPYHQVTAADAWIDDVQNPLYNQHVVVDLKAPPPWYEKEKMKLGDPTYRWLVEVRHNANPPVAGDGSAIFLHVRRAETRPTFGCTSMAEEKLEEVVCWLRADQHPHYALLPKAEYERVWKAWGLPAP